MQTNMPDEYREKIKRILDDERWKGYVSGKARRASLGGCSRGGNSTHMELAVMHDRNSLDFDLRLGRITREEYEERIKKAGYYFMIDGIHRAFESVNFYLALSDAGLPVIITDADKLVASFTGSDYIGIVPHHVVTRYCGELFPKEYEDIFDFSHVSKA